MLKKLKAHFHEKIGHVGDKTKYGNPRHPLSTIKLWGLREEETDATYKPYNDDENEEDVEVNEDAYDDQEDDDEF